MADSCMNTNTPGHLTEAAEESGSKVKTMSRESTKLTTELRGMLLHTTAVMHPQVGFQWTWAEAGPCGKVPAPRAGMIAIFVGLKMLPEYAG